MTLPPGAYTALVSPVGGRTGLGVIEVFEIDHPEVPMIQLATRARVLTGDNVMIGGFIIQGGPMTVVVKAIGPSLGVPNPLANPTLTLVPASGAPPITNDDWGSAANAAQLAATPFAPSHHLEAAILVTLQPGAYTGIVSGVGGGTGLGMFQISVVN